VISIFQTVTSIQEQTLTFVPKILSIFIALLIFGSFIMNTIVGYMTTLWSNFSIYTK
jgi:flagellar biosynthetic protein FliQ